MSGSGSHRRALDGLEQLAPADPEAAHHPPVQPHQDLGDRRVAFGEREELQVAQPAQQVELSDAYSGLDFGFILWVIRPCRQNADTVMGRHGAITAVDLGIVERGLVHAALQIVGHQQARPRAPEPEHPHMRADPVRQALRPGRLRVGEIGRAQHGDEDLRLAHRAGHRVDDRHLLAREVDEGLVTGNMGLPHAGRQPALELPEQLAVSAVGVAVSVNGPIFLPQDHQVDARDASAPARPPPSLAPRNGVLRPARRR